MSSDQTGGGAGTLVVGQIARGPRLSDQVADALTELILSGRLQVGDRLPSERELCEQFGVSRPVVREAVRSLIAKRLLADHPRRGHVVARVESASVSESLLLFVRGRPLDYSQISEIRRVLEVETAGLAAERASAEQVEALGAAAARMTVGLPADEAALIDIEFHRLIAQMTGNEYFVMFLDSLREVLRQVQRPTLADPKIVKGVRAAHRRIFLAIQAHDPDAARAAMRTHLATAERQMRALVTSAGGSVSVS
jgi:GntR family transcriptional repressor for pyruvate dehydrogenase complex